MIPGENLKTEELLSPLQLLRGMTTSTQKHPSVCLGSADLFNPPSEIRWETTFGALHRNKGLHSGLGMVP